MSSWLHKTIACSPEKKDTSDGMESDTMITPRGGFCFEPSVSLQAKLRHDFRTLCSSLFITELYDNYSLVIKLRGVNPQANDSEI